MRVLVLGSGGRESALAWALHRSASVREVVAAPGNPGIARYADVVAVDPPDPAAAVALARRVRPDLVVIGPESPLVAGVADALRRVRVDVFGPDAAAARIEGSKAYAKQLMHSAGIPTARARVFTEPEAAAAFMDQLGPPYVVKADGLAAGKGVVVTSERDVALRALRERMVDRRFGDAGARVVIEEYLDGEEVSLIAFSDGRTVLPCEPAQDYKRAFDHDWGPNTGGMGSYSPVPACPPDLAERIAKEVLEPMVHATARAGAPFVGALYAGLSLTSDGPKVVEFNARFGDPETQALLPRLESDFGDVCRAAARGDLGGARLQWSRDVCVSIVLASGGYPGRYATGVPIMGVDRAEFLHGVTVFHAGTKAARDGLVTAGGRVVAVSAVAPTFAQARALGYRAANRIHFRNMYMRSDIGLRAERWEAFEREVR
ncbi:MAG TPA: phosphoribosylamine--glycine ligase [Actinomycetota bacterium]|nr:phosphoribosylamine--glycine ligase [Actinomycetota bacterium]